MMILTLALQRWLKKVFIASPLCYLTLLPSRLDGCFGPDVTNLPLKGSLLQGIPSANLHVCSWVLEVCLSGRRLIR